MIIAILNIIDVYLQLDLNLLVYILPVLTDISIFVRITPKGRT